MCKNLTNAKQKTVYTITFLNSILSNLEISFNKISQVIS